MLYIKALHIIFVITWFAGLFYIVRLFVYHSESDSKPEPERSILKNHFKIAERRLWYGITWPSAVGTYIFGFWYLFRLYGTSIPDWLLLKLGFVLGLTIYHLICHKIFNQYQSDKIKYSSMQMRLWNEAATVFLITIVFIVELKNLTNWVWGLGGLIIFSLLLIAAIRIYKRIREKKEK